MKNDAGAREYFRAFYHKNHLRGAAALAGAMLETPVNLFASWMIGAITDAATAGDLPGLWRVLRLTLAVVAVFAALELAAARAQAAYVHRALEQYKSLAFRRLSEKSISAFSRENTGRYLSVLTNDVNTIEEKYLVGSLGIVNAALLFAGSLGMMLWYSPLLTACTLALCLLPLIASLASGGAVTAREQEVSARGESFLSRLKDLLGGFAVLKSFKAEREARQLFDESNRAVESAKRRRRWCTGVVGSVAALCGLLMQLGVFFIGGYLTIRGNITGGTMLVFVNLCNCLIGPVNAIPQYWAGRKAAKSLVEKLARVTAENAGREGEAIRPVLEDAIELRGVSFGYEPDKPVLRDLSLRLEPGRSYALVGASGSGKSTLLNLLMGARDDYGGSLTIDGKELRDIDPDSLYDLMSLIGQEVFLFDDTIERNVTMFREFPAGRVASAEERSGLAALIGERGPDYRCGENGANLSGGERQRVSIARCLLRAAPVLLLDEATASLDNQTAFEVTSAILDLDGLTRLVVTHRLERTLLERYDGILVLRDGRLWESGRFDELMEKKGYFYSLFTVANG